MFDYQAAFNVAFLIAGASVGLWVKSVSDKNEDRKREIDKVSHEFKGLQQTVSNMRETIPQRYATIDDVKDATARIERASSESAERQDRVNERLFNTLERIESKIDQKANK